MIGTDSTTSYKICLQEAPVKEEVTELSDVNKVRQVAREQGNLWKAKSILPIALLYCFCCSLITFAICYLFQPWAKIISS